MKPSLQKTEEAAKAIERTLALPSMRMMLAEALNCTSSRILCGMVELFAKN